MKKMIFLLVILSIAQTGFSQKVKAADVPDAVKTAFAKKFPNPSEVEKWEKEDGNFEVEFEMSEDNEMSAVFAADGRWLETEQEIKTSELPVAVLAKLTGKRVKEAARITRADGSTIYEAEVKGGDLLFDANGMSVGK